MTHKQRSFSRKVTLPHPAPIIAKASSSTHLVANPSHNSIFSAADENDADAESDGNATDDDDEYTPSPRLNARKRPRSSSRESYRAPSLTSTSSRNKRQRLPPPSRNTQAASPAAIARAVSEQSPTSLNFTCPECGWKQTNERMPDFKRHLRTHTRPSDQDQQRGWWCKGVLLSDVQAGYHRVPEGSVAFEFQGQWRIGGCVRTFSRRDALKRHLDNCNVRCLGKPTSATED